MKIRNSIKAACAALLFGAASQAMATVITLDASLPAGYLSTGRYQGSFDGSALLPEQFIINSIGFSFNFADDATDDFSTVSYPSVTTQSGPVEVSLTGGDKSSTITKTKTTSVSKMGEQEAVQLSFGSLIFSAQTLAGTPVFTSNTVPGTAVLDRTTYMQGNKTCTPSPNNSSCKAIYHYTVTNTVTNTTTTDYTGNISLTQSLLSQSGLLAELMQTKALNFGLGVTGDLNLVSASLNLDYTDTTPSPVPEPASLALFGIALLGFAGARVRRG